MSLKAELETWAAALHAYDEENFEYALELFARIADSSKILTNMGLIYATLGMHDAAVAHFIRATQLDQYLAVAYFQCGVSNFLLARYDLACKDFQETLVYLRGNKAINYEQLGLKFKLFSAEVLFNKGLSQLYLGRIKDGLAGMEEARREKATEEHDVIDDAIRDCGDGYTVFSIPVGILYRPSEKKLKNASPKDYLGKAKLVASSDANDTFTTFTGSTRLKQGISPSGVYVESLERERPEIIGSPSLTRSTTLPISSPMDFMDGGRSIERSKTFTNTVSRARENANPMPYKFPPRATPLTRSNTGYSGERLSPSNLVPETTLSLRRRATARSPQTVSPSSNISRVDRDGRTPDLEDDYSDGHENNFTQLSSLHVHTGFASSSQPPSSSRSSNSQRLGNGGGSLRRNPSQRLLRTRTRGHNPHEDEEGYGSGDHDDGPELSKIRVKLYYQDDVRGMTFHPETSFEDFMKKLTKKFDKALDGLGLKFKDEDGSKITLRDESDYDLAVETAREIWKTKSEGKLEIWCTDTIPSV